MPPRDAEVVVTYDYSTQNVVGQTTPAARQSIAGILFIQKHF